MTFLEGEELNKSISELAQGSKVRFAVAFWGRGAENLFKIHEQDIKIICNLSSGGTNPNVIKKMIEGGICIRQLDRLHAKVYIGDGNAIITSANASANGLGLENSEQAHWDEAGMLQSDIKAVSEWFEKLWLQSREILPTDIKKALVKWHLRRANRPTVSFPDFDINSERCPLVAWVGDEDWEACEENVRSQLGYFDVSVRKRIDLGIEIEGEDDIAILKPGTWVLNWKRTTIGFPDFRVKPWWTYTDTIIRGGYFYLSDEEKLLDVALQAEQVPPAPFDVSDSIFVSAFREVISRDTYLDLRTDNYSGAWFAPRIVLMQTFWLDLQREYRKLAEEG